MAAKKSKTVPSSYGDWTWIPEIGAWCVHYETGSVHNGMTRRYGFAEDTYSDGKRGPWVARIAVERFQGNYKSARPIEAARGMTTVVDARDVEEFGSPGKAREAVLDWFARNPITRY